MKRAELSMAKLSLSEKLELMEKFWPELTRDEAKLKSPSWHDIALKDREEAYAAGKITASDWEQAKKRIRKKAR
jgi:putative addiction module component (TIGR02574 family)